MTMVELRTRRKLGVRNVTLGLSLAFVSTACSTGFLGRLDPADELPADLPQELRQKFEVYDPKALSKVKEPVESPSERVSDAAPSGKKGALEKTVRPQASSALPQKEEKQAVAKRAAGREQKQAFVYPSRRPSFSPIRVGEQQVYDITYFGMLAGTLTLDVLPCKYINDRKVYAIRGRAVSSRVFSLFYRLDDTIESFFDFDGLFSHRFHLVLNESKQTRDALELYDNEKRETFYWNRWNHKKNGYKETKKFYEMTAAFPQDSLSALYFLRTLPLKDGEVYKFPVVSEGKTWGAEAHVVRREKMDTPLGEVDTVVVKPVTKFKGVVKQKGESFIWLTDDDRRIVVRLEAKVKVGTIIADLVSTRPGVKDSESVEGGGSK